MSWNNFISKIRQVDQKFARWMMRHFYTLFFQLVLVAIFCFFLINTYNGLDAAAHTDPKNNIEQLLAIQTQNSIIIVGLLILNSFWMLFMFNGINRLRWLLKDINYSILRQKHSKH